MVSTQEGNVAHKACLNSIVKSVSVYIITAVDSYMHVYNKTVHDVTKLMPREKYIERTQP